MEDFEKLQKTLEYTSGFLEKHLDLKKEVGEVNKKVVEVDMKYEKRCGDIEHKHDKMVHTFTVVAVIIGVVLTILKLPLGSIFPAIISLLKGM